MYSVQLKIYQTKKTTKRTLVNKPALSCSQPIDMLKVKSLVTLCNAIQSITSKQHTFLSSATTNTYSQYTLQGRLITPESSNRIIDKKN